MTTPSGSGRGVGVPLSARLAFAHAALQLVADEAHADVLHIKGVAVHPSIRAVAASGSDADVLVRPSHVPRVLAQLERHGWQHFSDFESGSAFGHASTLYHDSWGYGDIHRFFPGIGLGADEAFEQLWSAHTTRPIALISCDVPSLAAQLLILVLNAARSGGAPDRMALVRNAWESSPSELRDEVVALVATLQAEVAFSAGLGDVEQYRGRPDYLLWRVSSQGGTRLEEWVGRIRAAPTRGAALRLAARAPLVNTEHLGHRIGHRPSRLEILREFVARPYRGAVQELGRLRVRRGGRHPGKA